MKTDLNNLNQSERRHKVKADLLVLQKVSETSATISNIKLKHFRYSNLHTCSTYMQHSEKEKCWDLGLRHIFSKLMNVH